MFSISNKNKNNFQKEMELKQSLINTRNAIRKKYKDLHNEKLNIREKFSETYKPIIDPIKSLINTKKVKAEKIVTTPAPPPPTSTSFKFRTTPESVFKTANPAFRRTLFGAKPKSSSKSKSSFKYQLPHSSQHDISGISDLNTSMNVDTSATTSTAPDITATTTAATPSLSDDLSNEVEQIKENVKTIPTAAQDKNYGFRTHNGDLYMGTEPVYVKTVNNENLYSIRKQQWPVTPGLTNLLLSTNPKYYTHKDLDAYREMLLSTNAHKENYSDTGRIRRNESSMKYKKIISSLFPRRRRSIHRKPTEGEGYWWQQPQLKKPQTSYKTFNKLGTFNYTYWDDPNELVDRLRLLVASQAAGHTGHNNEIISIIEELREAKIIV